MEICKEHDSQLYCILETAAYTACSHREAVFHAITANRRIIILQFTCFMCVCGTSHLLKSSCPIMKRPSVFSYTVYFMGAISVTLHKEGAVALLPRVHLSLPGATNNFTCNLHFKSRCRVVKETN